MAAFNADRVKDALWPEAIGMFAYAGAELALANIDAMIANKVNNYPVAQTAGTAAAVIGSIVGIGRNVATDFCKGVLYASIVGMMVNLVRSLWEMSKGQTTTSVARFAALIPGRVPALTATQKQALQAAISSRPAITQPVVTRPTTVTQPGLIQLVYE